MTNSISNDIRAALEQKLQSVCNLPGEYDGVPYEPTPDSPYMVVTMVSGSDLPATVGTSPQTLSEGLFVIKLYYPTGAGAHDLENMADQITSGFPVDQVIHYGSAYLRVRYAQNDRQARVEAGLWLSLTITVAWYVYH